MVSLSPSVLRIFCAPMYWVWVDGAPSLTLTFETMVRSSAPASAGRAAAHVSTARRRYSWLIEESLLMPSILQSKLRGRSEEHTSELQSQSNLVCRLLPEKQKSLATE